MKGRLSHRWAPSALVRIAVVLSAAFSVAFAQPGEPPTPDDFRFTRTIGVEQPGWARILLDGTMQVHAGRSADWTVWDPQGARVALRVLEAASGKVEARLSSFPDDPEGRGTLLVFDLGPRPLHHERLEVGLKGGVRAQGCRLEGSDDGRSWRALTTGDLFRLGEGEGLQQTALEYDPTRARYLRLLWPKEAGDPESGEIFRKIQVETARGFPGGPVEFPLETRPVVSTGAMPAYRVILPPESPLLSLVLQIEAAAEFGYSLERLENQRWTRFRTGLEAAVENRATLRVGTPPIQSAGSHRLRLRLHARSGSPPKLLEATGALAPRWILFEAPRSGEYTLGYGLRVPPAVSPPPVLDLERVTKPAMDLTPGVEQSRPFEPLPKEATRPAAPTREPWYSARYSALAEGVEAGTVVRLELPVAVTTELFGRRSSIRLRSGDREIPFVRWIPPEPALALEAAGLDAEPVEGEEPMSRIVLDLPADWMLVNRLELSSSAPVFERRVEAHLERTPRPGVETSRLFLGTETWQCTEDPEARLLPCELALNVQPARGDWERLVVSFHDGDAEPLEDLRLSLWRRREAVVFVWPPEGNVTLLVISGENYAPVSSRLGRYSDRLIERMRGEVRLDLEGAEAREKASDILRRGWLTVALALMAVVLLVVLARSMKAPSQPKQ